MNIPKGQIVQVEYKGAADALKPIVFKEGDLYCCLLGPDPQSGVFGCGDTPEEAVQDWDEHLAAHLADAGENDEVVKHVKGVLDELNGSVKHSDINKSTEAMSDIEAHIASIQDPETASEVKRFYDQFKP